MRDGNFLAPEGSDAKNLVRPAPCVRPAPYLLGSLLYLLGSCCFFAGGLGTSGDTPGSQVWSDLYNTGNGLFVVGSVLFVYDGYCAARKSSTN
jgi:hypothetical protein|mmetsp:Transcript_11481/g.42553  ORF Transcript_11481/g.42553 Transcript_11481/m.42553 type:complete len:93 (+) Transcript_11481:155-433(+)